jgi:hypothetical protein
MSARLQDLLKAHKKLFISLVLAWKIFFVVFFVSWIQEIGQCVLYL